MSASSCSAEVGVRDWLRSAALFVTISASVYALDTLTGALQAHDWIVDTGVTPSPARASHSSNATRVGVSTISPFFGRCDAMTWSAAFDGVAFAKFGPQSRTAQRWSKMAPSPNEAARRNPASERTDDVDRLAACGRNLAAYTSVGEYGFHAVRQYLLSAIGAAAIAVAVPTHSAFFGSLQVLTTLKVVSCAFASKAFVTIYETRRRVVSQMLDQPCTAAASTNNDNGAEAATTKLAALGYRLGDAEWTLSVVYYAALSFAVILAVATIDDVTAMMARVDRVEAAQKARNNQRLLENDPIGVSPSTVDDATAALQSSRSTKVLNTCSILLGAIVVALVNTFALASPWFVAAGGPSQHANATSILIGYGGIARCDAAAPAPCVDGLLWNKVVFALVVGACVLLTLAVTFTGTFALQRSTANAATVADVTNGGAYAAAVVCHAGAAVCVALVIATSWALLHTSVCEDTAGGAPALGDRWTLGDVATGSLHRLLFTQLIVMTVMMAWKYYY